MLFLAENSTLYGASMKALPERKGNVVSEEVVLPGTESLNESPSGKEGKYRDAKIEPAARKASMKALPERKGNH